MGRVAIFAAKQALLGRKVFVVNSGEALITGRKSNILEKYKTMRARGGTAQKGPFFSKSPEKIMKRIIRGMIPYKKGRGRTALKDVLCYNDVPKELEVKKKVLMVRELKVKTNKLSLISKEL